MLNQEFQASGFIAQCIFSINNHNKAVCHQRSALKSMETWRQMGAYTQHWGQWAWLGLYTLNDHFIKCIWLGSIWLDPFFFFFLRTVLILNGTDLASCWKHSSEILVHSDMITSHSCWFNPKLSFHHMPEVLYWTQSLWPWRSSEYSELSVMFFEGCKVGTKGPTPFHLHQQHELLKQSRRDSWFHVVKFCHSIKTQTRKCELSPQFIVSCQEWHTVCSSASRFTVLCVQRCCMVVKSSYLTYCCLPISLT